MELNVHNTLRGVDSQDDNLTSYTLTYFYWSAVDLRVEVATDGQRFYQQ